MLALMFTTAWAGEYVLDLDGHEDPAGMVGAVTGTTMKPVTVPALAARPGRVEGGGTLSWCAGAPTSVDSLASEIEAAEKAMAYMEHKKAAEILTGASASTGCLADAVDSEVLARLYYLQGIVAQRSGFDDKASEAFADALVFQPDMSWDDTFPPKAKALFEAAKEAGQGAGVPLVVVPAQDLTMDGAPVGGSLAPGRHLVQAQGQTAWLEVFPGTSPTLVLPLGLAEDALSPFDSDAQAVLAAVAGDDTVHVVADGAIWVHAEGAWTSAELPKAPKAPREPREPRERTPREGGRPAVAIAGAGVTVAGAGLWAVSARNASTIHAGAQEAVYWDDYTQMVDDLERAVLMGRVGQGLTGVGLAVTAGGTVLHVTGTGVSLHGEF